MFPFAVGLIALGYTVLYWGTSMARAFSKVHKEKLTPNSKGGIPFGVLLGVNKKPSIGRGQDNLGEGQTFPPFVTSADNLLPKDQPR